MFVEETESRVFKLHWKETRPGAWVAVLRDPQSDEEREIRSAEELWDLLTRRGSA